MSLSDLRLQIREKNDEFNSLKEELAREQYHKDESQDLANHLQQQNAFVEEATKV